MTKLEKDIERKLRKMVERHGGLCLKWVCPGWSGVPDRILLLPGGRVMFVETKRPDGGRVSKLQRWWINKLTELGFTAGLAWTDNDVQLIEKIINQEGKAYGRIKEKRVGVCGPDRLRGNEKGAERGTENTKR